MSATPMKDRYKGLTIEGYHWGGYDAESGLHMFARQVKQRWQEVEGDPGMSRLVRDDEHGWWHGLWDNVLATTEDIEDGNAEWMMRNGYTRPPCYRKPGDVCSHKTHPGWDTIDWGGL